MTPSPLDSPAYKLHVKHVYQCEEVDSDTWKLALKNPRTGHQKTLLLKIIWLQGIVHDVVASAGGFILKDSTGNMLITGCSSVPGGCDWLAKGINVAVLGSLTKSGSRTIITATKLTNLADAGNAFVLAAMWDDEITDLHSYLLGNSKPAIS